MVVMDWLDIADELGRRVLGRVLRWLWRPLALLLVWFLVTHYVDDYVAWQAQRQQKQVEQLLEHIERDLLPPTPTPVAPGKLRQLRVELGHR